MAGLKFDDEKPRVDLIPMRPLMSVGRVMGFGARKYGHHNWREGIAVSRYLGAALRHLIQYADPFESDLDEETGESHLAHAACCVLMIMDTDPSLDDRWKRESQ